ncbi:13955_t:CDS:2 [Entrophospora sp. SA101]|nr:1391_t:CDS:2 [Entrophospora sp. SA101]CAJ0865953.1 13955_t:CDS:2 [Entrophospora sp. SA101]
MNKKALLISIEGIDGSGKSTLIKKLNETIINSVITQSPRGTILGEKVWDLVTENLPDLAAGKTVLTDRYIDSTLVYQGIRGKIPITKLVELEFHQVIRNGYLKMKSYFPERIHIINADRSQDEYMELMAFQFLGKVRKISKKKVQTGEFIKEPCCYVDYPPPYPKGTEYYEIILEKDEFSQDYNDFENGKSIKLVFFWPAI